MSEYVGYRIVVKEGQAREIANEINPFSAFPELKKLFENFGNTIKELEFEVDVPEYDPLDDYSERYSRIFFKIVRRK